MQQDTFLYMETWYISSSVNTLRIANFNIKVVQHYKMAIYCSQVTKQSPSGTKVVSILSQTCIKVVTNLFTNCPIPYGVHMLLIQFQLVLSGPSFLLFDSNSRKQYFSCFKLFNYSFYNGTKNVKHVLGSKKINPRMN